MQGEASCRNSWLSSYRDVRAHHAQDAIYHKIATQIQQHVKLLQRHAQVRVMAWLKKLSDEVRGACTGETI